MPDFERVEARIGLLPRSAKDEADGRYSYDARAPVHLHTSTRCSTKRSWRYSPLSRTAGFQCIVIEPSC